MTLKDLILEKINEPVEEFCEKVGISKQTYYNIMNGKKNYKSKNGIYKPSILTIKRICNCLGVDPKNYI